MVPDTVPVGKGYALWLTPAEPIFNRFAREISRLSRELSTPRFDPHVTLLGRILLSEEKALARSARLAGMLKPTRVELSKIAHLDEYFRCLFVTVVGPDSIIKARQTACRVLGRQNTVYMPHVSLVYGKLSAAARERIAARMSSMSGQAFNVRSLALYRVSGAPREWKCIRRFALK
jgi:2'-5' RNA ligase